MDNNKLIIKFGRIRNSVITVFVNIPEWVNGVKSFYYRDYSKISEANYTLQITDKMGLPQMSEHVLWIPKGYSDLHYNCSYTFSHAAEAKMWIEAMSTIINKENEKHNNIENTGTDGTIIWTVAE